MSLVSAESMSRSRCMPIKPWLFIVTVSFAWLAGCAAKPEPKDAYISAPVFESTGSPGGSFTSTLGVLMIERATGEVSFCNTACSSMAKIHLGATDRLTAQPGNNAKVRLVNETSGEIVTCTVSFKQTKGSFGWSYNFFNKDNEVVFQSGACHVAPVHRINSEDLHVPGSAEDSK